MAGFDWRAAIEATRLAAFSVRLMSLTGAR
jgi:hypothetical protein